MEALRIKALVVIEENKTFRVETWGLFKIKVEITSQLIPLTANKQDWAKIALKLDYS